MSNDETALLERAFGTTFARALAWCTEIPGYRTQRIESDAAPQEPQDDDGTLFGEIEDADDDEHRNE